MKLLTATILILMIVSQQAFKLPSLKGTIQMTELIQKNIYDALAKHDSDLSRDIEALISLSLSQGQYDQIFEILGEILDDLYSDQTAENGQYSTALATLQTLVTTYTAAYNTATQSKSAQETINVAQNRASREAVASKISVQGQITTLQALILSTTQQHDRDVTAQSTRYNAHQAKIGALNIIIGDLEQIRDGQSEDQEAANLAQIQQVVQKMKQVGDSNPLLTLVELSTTFDAATVNSIITKLQAILRNVQESQRDDQADQVTMNSQYTIINSQQTDQLAGFNTQIGTLTTFITAIDLKIVATNALIAQFVIDQDNSKLQWDNTLESIETEKCRHYEAILDIQSEIDTVNEVIVILSNSLGYVQEEMNDDNTYVTEFTI